MLKYAMKEIKPMQSRIITKIKSGICSDFDQEGSYI